jgi:hypothetical protein
MPNLGDARGVVDRSFSFTTYKGLPKYDIKETLEPQGSKARQQRLDDSMLLSHLESAVIGLLSTLQ